MEKYIPLSKLSKRARREYNASRRGSWNGVDPVSRTIPGKNIYNRKKQKQAERLSGMESMCSALLIIRCAMRPAGAMHSRHREAALSGLHVGTAEQKKQRPTLSS